jgi:hypothetical protein
MHNRIRICLTRQELDGVISAIWRFFGIILPAFRTVLSRRIEELLRTLVPLVPGASRYWSIETSAAGLCHSPKPIISRLPANQNCYQFQHPTSFAG